MFEELSMKKIDMYQVDAFTSRLFGGNPAAVCPLETWLPDEVMQSIAIENCLSETAFFVPLNDGFELRWFTPEAEIDLCGHATLATAYVLFEHLGYTKPVIRFATRFVGDISVTKNGDWLTLDFPAWDAPVVEAPKERVDGIGLGAPMACFAKRDYMFVYADEEAVRNVAPDFGALRKLGRRNICITAPGKDCDFVSRFFSPGDTPEEDPVTGSAHSMLIPYWAKRLGKNKMLARQVSQRGGELRCEFLGERVLISGQGRTYMVGQIFLP
jgi:PhzF family phenazine biosynthesis protein